MNTNQYCVLDFSLQSTVELSAPGLSERFDRDGVLVLPDFFDHHVLDGLNAAMDGYFEPRAAEALAMSGGHQQRTAKFACDVISWDPVKTKHPLFVGLRESSALREVTECLLGPGFSTPASLVMFSVGGGRGQAWHQDCPIEEEAGFNLNRLIYTRDVDPADGAIVVVPGSHRAGRIPPGGHQDPMPDEVMLCPRAGTLVMLHGHVYHRVTPNAGTRPRLSINLRAYPQNVDPDINCIGVYRNGTIDFCDHTRGPNSGVEPEAAETQS
ncbi:MAG: phytanoyl-CoA dioxygenase family protein [Planctomycetota bacterium]